jgi:hypothetical protein
MNNKILFSMLMLCCTSNHAFSADMKEYNYSEFQSKTMTLHQGYGEGTTPNTARVVFSKDDLSIGDEFMAQILSTQRGLDIYIYTPEKCAKDSINEVNLNISDQNVMFYKKCDSSGSTFVVKSDVGRSYLADSFKKNQLVAFTFLDSKKRIVKFNTFGFSKVWVNMGGDSL